MPDTNCLHGIWVFIWILVYITMFVFVVILCHKATREKIVSETAKYIILLEEKKRQLEKLKESSKSMAPIIGTVPNSNFSDNFIVTSNVTFFGIQMLVKQGLLTKIFMVFHKHQAEVLAANVAVNHGQVMVTITACVNSNGGNTVEKIKKEILIL